MLLFDKIALPGVGGWYDQAERRLQEEYKGVKGYKESTMAGAVRDALLEFCRQDEEFAQAVVQGGSFKDCMSAVAKGVGASVSDLEAFKRAVRFYFPGANVQFHMEIELCPGHNDRPSGGKSGMLLNLDDFL